ncbi:unnamed protein product [Schistosoma rodhaini]|nr:unnamed protein product [Schistosoma rodhaini]
MTGEIIVNKSMKTYKSTPIHSFMFSIHFIHVYKYTHMTLNSRHNCTPTMNSIKVLFICMCLYTIVKVIEADTEDKASAIQGEASEKIAKPTRKHSKLGIIHTTQFVGYFIIIF